MALKLEQSLTAVVIEPRVDMRSVVKETLRDIGIRVLADTVSMKEGLSAMEQIGIPNWIVTSFDPDERWGSLALAALILKEAPLSGVRISWLISKDDQTHIPLGYAMGILSHHFKPCTKAQLKDQWQRLMSDLKSANGRDAIVAADYLRNYLGEVGDHKAMIEMEKSLVQRFPEVADLHVKLAEAFFMAGETKSAESILSYAEHLSPSTQLAVKQLRQLIGPAKDASGPIDTIADQLQHCLIIDVDGAAATQTGDTLRSLGARKISIASCAQDALRIASENQPTLVVQEWRMPDISGPGLLQRWRTDPKNASVPVVVVSSLLKEDDKPLLQEMGVLFSLPKPINRDVLISSLASSLSASLGGDIKSLERQFKVALLADHQDEARQVSLAIISSPHASEGLKCLVKAELAYLDGKYEEARGFAAIACRSHADPLSSINLLGRILLKIGDKNGARKCFERAQKMSPKNIERLCSLVELHTDNGDSANAAELLETATAIDRNSVQVQQASALFQLANGKTAEAAAIVEGPGVLKGVVAYLNNRAVSMAQSGMIEDSIKLYQEALKVMPPNATNIKCSLALNLSLAMARMGNIKEAINTIKTAPKATNARLEQKLSFFSDLFDKSIKNGRPLKWSTAHNIDSEHENAEILTSQICLHGVFLIQDDEASSRIRNALCNSPRFKMFEQVTHIRDKAS